MEKKYWRVEYKINDQVYTEDFYVECVDHTQVDLGMSARSAIRRTKKHSGVATWEIKIIRIDPI
ncbi:MAG: hypothetical protein KAX05_15590 [Bacteroidales bacterium]|nr:hypothetical protein [Bacteroidales bacterium]